MLKNYLLDDDTEVSNDGIAGGGAPLHCAGASDSCLDHPQIVDGRGEHLCCVGSVRSCLDSDNDGPQSDTNGGGTAKRGNHVDELCFSNVLKLVEQRDAAASRDRNCHLLRLEVAEPKAVHGHLRDHCVKIRCSEVHSIGRNVELRSTLRMAFFRSRLFYVHSQELHPNSTARKSERSTAATSVTVGSCGCATEGIMATFSCEDGNIPRKCVAASSSTAAEKVARFEFSLLFEPKSPYFDLSDLFQLELFLREAWDVVEMCCKFSKNELAAGDRHSEWKLLMRFLCSYAF